MDIFIYVKYYFVGFLGIFSLRKTVLLGIFYLYGIGFLGIFSLCGKLFLGFLGINFSRGIFFLGILWMYFYIEKYFWGNFLYVD